MADGAGAELPTDSTTKLAAWIAAAAESASRARLEDKTEWLLDAHQRIKLTTGRRPTAVGGGAHPAPCRLTPALISVAANRRTHEELPDRIAPPSRSSGAFKGGGASMNPLPRLFSSQQSQHSGGEGEHMQRGRLAGATASCSRSA